MALALRKEAVLRGRASDGFAEASIVTEPSPTAQDMAMSSETIVKMNSITTQVMSKLVHIALEKPYLGDPQATVTLTYGYAEATAIGQDTFRDDGVGSNPVPASERLSQMGQGAAPRFVRGKPIHWHLRFEKGPLGNCACGQDPETEVGPETVMPGPVARYYFGDWDVLAYEAKAALSSQQLEPWLTRVYHRDRVGAEHWGGYEMDFPAGVSSIYDQRGAINTRALRRFAPPNVPHVAITRLDTMMRKLPNTAARPWEIFKWEDSCEKGARMHFFENKPAANGMVSVTPDDLQKLIAQGVQAFMAAQSANKGKTA